MIGAARVGSVGRTLDAIFDPSCDRLEVAQVRDAAIGFKTFSFRLPPGKRLRFLPGQSLTLALPIAPESAYRTFTIASSPTRPNVLEMTVKIAGVATRWMHEALQPGMQLAVGRPTGNFTIARHPTARALFVSAGSGITPVMSMLRWLADRGERTDIIFLHQAHAPDTIPFLAELDALANSMAALTVVLSVAVPPSNGDWPGPTGRIHAAAISRFVPDLASREVFCCGPVGFMDMCRDAVVANGGTLERFHTENFQPPQNVAASTDTAAAPGAFEIEIGGRRLSASRNETIAAAALRSGVAVPTSCQVGLCGTCKVRLLAGSVEMHHQGGLAARDERAGYILACCSRPRSNLTLQFDT